MGQNCKKFGIKISIFSLIHLLICLTIQGDQKYREVQRVGAGYDEAGPRQAQTAPQGPTARSIFLLLNFKYGNIFIYITVSLISLLPYLQHEAVNVFNFLIHRIFDLQIV